MQDDKLKLEKRVKDTENKLTYQKKLMLNVKQEFSEMDRQKSEIDMQNKSIMDFLQTKDSEHLNIQKYLETLKQRRDQLEIELEQMRMKLEKNRNKLKFFKTQYVGFEVAKKALEEKENQTRLRLLAKEKDYEWLMDKFQTLEEKYETS